MSRKLIITGLAGVVCLAYYSLLTFFNVGIPCLFHKITGLLCPGCGITRMILAILHLDFKSAFQYNSVIFVFSPVIIYFIIRLYISWLKSESYKLSLLENIVVYIMLIVLLIFGIIRNLI
jgi:hypothetical protein